VGNSSENSKQAPIELYAGILLVEFCRKFFLCSLFAVFIYVVANMQNNLPQYSEVPGIANAMADKIKTLF